MSLEQFDKALERKLKEVFENVLMAPPDDAFARSNKAGKVNLPLITAYRMSNNIEWAYYNQHAAFRGQRTGIVFKDTPDTTPEERYEVLDRYRVSQTLPVNINYQIDIWAQLRQYADDIFRELTFYLMHFPNLYVDIPSSDNPLVFSLNLTDVDTSTDYEFDDTNTIHRYTLTYEIPHAQIFMEPTPVPYVKTIPVEYIIQQQDNDPKPAIEYTVTEAKDEDIPRREIIEDTDEDDSESPLG